MVIKVSNAAMVNFKAAPKDETTEATKSIEPVKNGDSKLKTTLACLATLGIGTVATVYAFTKGNKAGLKEGQKIGEEIGRLAGFKEGHRAGLNARKLRHMIPTNSEYLNEAQLTGFCKISGGKVVKLTPEELRNGNYLIAKEIKIINGKPVTVNKVINAQTGETVGMRSNKKYENNPRLYTSREHFIDEKGNKVTKKTIYNDDGSVSIQTIKSSYDKETGVLRKEISNGQQGELELSTKDGYRYRVITDSKKGYYVDLMEPSSIISEQLTGHKIGGTSGWIPTNNDAEFEKVMTKVRSTIKERNLPFNV